MLQIINAIGEIRTHYKVSSIDFPSRKELRITFIDTFADLIVPISKEMDSNLLVGIFYNYLNTPESKLARA